jgi:thymidine kinase
MIPKEKAKELFIKYRNIIIDDVLDKKPIYFIMSDKMAKQCALIAVDELINTEYQTVSKLLDVIQKNKIRLVISLNKDYWQEVKQEIRDL